MNLCILMIHSLFFFFFLMIRLPPTSTLFPTRRSSDLGKKQTKNFVVDTDEGPRANTNMEVLGKLKPPCLDRKSTRLNSSHSQISNAVFCLKKKKNIRLYINTNIYNQTAILNM